MGVLFGRTGTLTLGTTQIKFAQGGSLPLKVEFQVKKDLKPQPNKTRIRVWGLSPQTRKSLEQPKLVPVQLDVGYGGDNHTIYLGQLRSAQSEKDGRVEVVTTIASGDSEPAFSQNRSLFQVPKQASGLQLLQLASKALAIGAGNLAQAVPTATTGGPARVYHGLASTVFSDVAASNGMEWSVQDGAMQLIPIGGNVGSSSTAVFLDGTSGMIGSPSVDNKGIVKVKSLIQPGLLPGRPVVINGEFLQGTYRIETCDFAGDTWGPDWTVMMTCRKWK